MLFGYHEKKDLYLELTVKNTRTREIVNLEELGIKALIPVHNFNSSRGYYGNVEDSAFGQELEKLYDALNLTDVEGDCPNETRKLSGVDADGDHYTIFISLYDLSCNNYVWGADTVRFETSTKEYMKEFADLSWKMIKKVDLIKFISKNSNFGLPVKLQDKFDYVESYETEYFYSTRNLYSIVFTDGTSATCDSKKRVRQLIESHA